MAKSIMLKLKKLSIQLNLLQQKLLSSFLLKVASGKFI